jgi:hypothetical protein
MSLSHEQTAAQGHARLLPIHRHPRWMANRKMDRELHGAEIQLT